VYSKVEGLYKSKQQSVNFINIVSITPPTHPSYTASACASVAVLSSSFGAPPVGIRAVLRRSGRPRRSALRPRRPRVAASTPTAAEKTSSAVGLPSRAVFLGQPAGAGSRRCAPRPRLGGRSGRPSVVGRPSACPVCPSPGVGCWGLLGWLRYFHQPTEGISLNLTRCALQD